MKRNNLLTLLILCFLGKAVFAQKGDYLKPTKDTIGLWHFDEGSGIVAHDSSKNGLSGNLTGATNWIKSNWGYALNINGSSGYFGISDPKGKLGLLPKFTLEVWVSLSDISGLSNPVISRKAKNGKSAFELRFMTYPKGWAFKMQDQNGLPMVFYGRADINKNEWHHVAFSFDGQTGILFLDGVQISRMRIGNIMPPDLSSPWILGKGEGGQVFKGIIDELHFTSINLPPCYLRTGYTIYGIGKPGTNYIFPTIRLTGGQPSTNSNSMNILVEKGYPNMLGILFISKEPAFIPIPGGIFFVSGKTLFTTFFLLDGGLVGIPGTAKANINIPAPGPSLLGSYICTQALLFDPGGYMGFSLTPGMLIWFPY